MMLTRNDQATLPSQPAGQAAEHEAFIEGLGTIVSGFPNRAIMEIECIDDVAELTALKQLIDERIAWLGSKP